MKFYKFKSIDGDGLSHVMDTILNRRIFLSKRDKMNDAFEGACQFVPKNASQIRDLTLFPKFLDEISKCRFTCFVAEPKNILMWSHYAGGNFGVAMEYDINDPSVVARFKRIIYSNKTYRVPYRTIKNIVDKKAGVRDCEVLRRKSRVWNYEKEYRVFAENENDEYINDISPVALILGPRFQGEISGRENPLLILCKMLGITIRHCGILRIGGQFGIYTIK